MIFVQAQARPSNSIFHSWRCSLEPGRHHLIKNCNFPIANSSQKERYSGNQLKL